MIPNGVDVPSETADSRFRETGAPRRALFLSRVHPKKGLPLLLDAWAEVRPAGWELVVAGPDEGGHRAEMEAQAARLGIAGDVRFGTPWPTTAKWALYRSADLFVLPTHSENFGVVVAEALAAGVPALTTVGAPWRDAPRPGCGWWTAIGVRPLAEALRDAASRSDAERARHGRPRPGPRRPQYAGPGPPSRWWRCTMDARPPPAVPGVSPVYEANVVPSPLVIPAKAGIQKRTAGRVCNGRREAH